jgi:hypothetical protein
MILCYHLNYSLIDIFYLFQHQKQLLKREKSYFFNITNYIAEAETPERIRCKRISEGRTRAAETRKRHSEAAAAAGAAEGGGGAQ